MPLLKSPKSPLRLPLFCAGWLAAAALLAHSLPAAAQSYCASDGQPQPVQLLERFINADCDSCWNDPATPSAAPDQIALDWVLPGSQGDEAPLSAVATRDAQARLQALGQSAPASALTLTQTLRPVQGAALRVAHGLPVADYIGASIELRPVPAAARQQHWTSWLALVETLPVGTEGSPTARNLVRNLLQSNWDGRRQLSKTEQNRFFESRAMNIPPAASASRLGVIGWVEDAQGRVVAAAQSRCETP